jgi:hypothetical protein
LLIFKHIGASTLFSLSFFFFFFLFLDTNRYFVLLCYTEFNPMLIPSGLHSFSLPTYYFKNRALLAYCWFQCKRISTATVMEFTMELQVVRIMCKSLYWSYWVLLLLCMQPRHNVFNFTRTACCRFSTIICLV